MENWYGTLINQSNRHRELLEQAARERVANVALACRRHAIRVLSNAISGLMAFVVVAGVARIALRRDDGQRLSSENGSPQCANAEVVARSANV